MTPRGHLLTGAVPCDKLGRVKRERKGAVHASVLWPFLSVQIGRCMGGTTRHHHLNPPRNLSNKWGSPQSMWSSKMKQPPATSASVMR